VQIYTTTPDSAVSYLNHARIAQTDYTVVCFMTIERLQRKVVKTEPVQAECSGLNEA